MGAHSAHSHPDQNADADAHWADQYTHHDSIANAYLHSGTADRYTGTANRNAGAAANQDADSGDADQYTDSGAADQYAGTANQYTRTAADQDADQHPGPTSCRHARLCFFAHGDAYRGCLPAAVDAGVASGDVSDLVSDVKSGGRASSKKGPRSLLLQSRGVSARF
jgi:hypothetical protein